MKVREFPDQPERNASGMTLVEMIVAIAIGSLVLTVAMSLTMYTARGFQAISNYADLDYSSENALDTLSHDVRQAKGVAYYSTNRLIFKTLNGTLFSYTYDPQAGTLTRVWGGRSKVLLTHCDYLKFSIWQRNPTNTYGFAFFPASTPLTAKLVDVIWKCSRPIYAKKANTETIQTAQIVMRN